MATTKSLSVKLDLNIKGFSKNLEKATKQTKISMKKMGEAMKGMGKSLSASITLPAAVAGVAMIKLASDAEEVTNKFNEIFGSSAKKTGQSLDNLAKSVGRNSTSLKEFAGDMGGVVTSMGFSDEEAGKLSSSMIRLGIDVASFRNKSDAQVINAFTSAMVGERDALKSLGISILDADVKQEAFNMGIFKGKGALTKRATVLATQSLLFKRFSKDIGDAERTSDGFANTLKRFNATVKTLGESFGKILLPVATKFLNLLIPLVESLEAMDAKTRTLIVVFGAMAAALGPALMSLGFMTLGISNLMTAYGKLSGVVSTVIARFIAWDAISKTVITTTKIQTSTQALLGGGISKTSEKIVQQSKVQLALARSIGVVNTAFASFMVTMKGMTFAGVVAGIKSVSLAVGGLLKRLVLISIPVAAVVVAFALVVNAGMTLMRHWDDMKMHAKDIFNDVLRVVSETVREIKTWIVDKIKPIVDFWKISFNALAKVTNIVFGKVIKAVGGAVKKIVTWIKDKIVKAINVLIDGYNQVARLLGGKPLKPFADFDGVVDTAIDAYETVVVKTKEFAGDVKSGLKIIGDDIKKSNPFKTFAEETKKNMDQAKALFDSTMAKMGMGGPSLPPAVDPAGPAAGTKTGPANIDTDKVPQIEKSKTALQEFFEESKNISGQFNEMWADTFTMFSQGFGDAVAGAIMDGENLMESLKSLAEDLVKSIISTLVKMAAQFVITSLVGQTAVKAQAVTSIGAWSAVAYAAAFSAIAGIPLIGPALAPAAGAAAAAASKAGGLSLLAMAEGGITQGPTNALIGEAGQEAVIPLDKLDSMMGAREQTIIVELNEKVLTRSVIRNMPREVRMRAGVTY